MGGWVGGLSGRGGGWGRGRRGDMGWKMSYDDDDNDEGSSL